MRFTKRQKELIPETTCSITEGAISCFREDDEGGRARVTTDAERVLRGRWLSGDELMKKVWRLGSCENF